MGGTVMGLRVYIHNVGHGQAIHAFTPGGQCIAIDLGCSADFSPLEWLSGSSKTIDSLIITHPHGDHIDEMLILKKLGLKVRQLWRPNWLPKDEVYKQNQRADTDKLDGYFEMSDSYTETILDSELVGNPDVNGGVSIKEFASSTCGVSNINNHSGVVIFDYLGIRLIIPGDNEPPSWRTLLEQSSFKSAVAGAYVFMASHHGRESGYCPELFEAFPEKMPKLCVISDGRTQDTDATNRYSYHAHGWKVHSRSGCPSEDRYCVTTRSDGFIKIDIGQNQDGGNYLAVYTA